MNYQKEMEKILEGLKGRKPRLLLHACCAPCSSYVLEYLSKYFNIDVFFYNPNIHPEEEFARRKEEQERLCRQMGAGFLCPEYGAQRFYAAVEGREGDAEGGERCGICFRLRLEETCKRAKANEYDYFATTLTISPLKNARKINEIGLSLAEQYGVAYLQSDFKKREGYKRSLELSKQYGLYRQDYCGCSFSRRGDC